MLFDTNFNFLDFLLRAFLTVSHFTPSFSLMAKLMAKSFLFFGLIIILYWFYNLLKRLFYENHSKYLMVVSSLEKGYPNFELEGSCKCNCGEHTLQSIYSYEFLARFQLFENSYFNYFTRYSEKPLFEFNSQIPQFSLCLKITQNQDKPYEGINGHNALWNLLLQSNFGDCIFYERLRAEIFIMIENLKLRSDQQIDSSENLDGFPAISEEAFRILKEETIDFVIFLKPSLTLETEVLSEAQLLEFARNPILVPLTTSQVQAYYFYNWIDLKSANPPVNPELIKVGSFKYSHQEFQERLARLSSRVS